MLIITTVYIAETNDPAEPEANERSWQEAADLKEATRECVSIFEGKNRVLPID